MMSNTALIDGGQFESAKGLWGFARWHRRQTSTGDQANRKHLLVQRTYQHQVYVL